MQSPAPLGTSKSCIQVMHFLLSICAISFVFSQCCSIMFYLQMLKSHTLMEQTFFFFICNGILVFLAKTSDCMYVSTTSELSIQFLKNLNYENNFQMVSCSQASDEQQSPGALSEAALGEEIGYGTQAAEDEKGGDRAFNINGFPILEDSNEEDETGLLSVEEQNKRFDDFIRRMKEEIRVGAIQLVMAH